MENNRPAAWPGLWVWGGLGIAASVVLGIGMGLSKPFAEKGTLRMLDHLVCLVAWGVMFLGVLLGIVIVGIGSVVKAIRQNQRDKKKE